MLEIYDVDRSNLVSNILTDEEMWMYQYDPETKQQLTLCVTDDEEPATKLVKSRSVREKMIPFFFVVAVQLP